MNSSKLSIADDVKIYKTKDFSMFMLDTRNRPIEPGKVVKMEKSIRQRNLLRYYPIVVTPDGVIRDGQHRMVAAQRVDVEVYYIIASEMGIRDVAMTNSLSKQWTSHDYLNLHCEEKNPEYLALKGFMDNYPAIKIGTVISIGSSTSKREQSGEDKTNRTLESFRLGYYLFDPTVLTQLANFGISIAEVAPDWYTRPFLASLKHMFSHPEFRAKKLHSQIFRSPHLVVEQTKHESCLIMLQGIYNFHQQNRVSFYIP